MRHTPGGNDATSTTTVRLVRLELFDGKCWRCVARVCFHVVSRHSDDISHCPSSLLGRRVNVIYVIGSCETAAEY